jgi:hypothetical protein
VPKLRFAERPISADFCLGALGSQTQKIGVDLVGDSSDPTTPELHPFGEPSFRLKAPKMRPRVVNPTCPKACLGDQDYRKSRCA